MAASIWDKPTPQSQLSMAQNTSNYNKTWGPSVLGAQTTSTPQYSQPAGPVSYINQGPQKQSYPQTPSGGGSVGASVDPLAKVLGDSINTSANEQTNAANSQADAAKAAAWNSYNATKQAADLSKQEAKGTYDWIVDTLGSNKQDLLNKAALNETQSLEDLATAEKKTKTEYDTAKRDTLTGYRDVKLQQEKVMRGMGVPVGSRAMEAEMKLNNLLAKDISTVSTKEADSLSLIANAVATVKTKAKDTRDSIERETKSKVDQATLEYQQAVNNIDRGMFASVADRENAIKEAEANLAKSIADIKTWKANTTVNAQLQLAQIKGNLDEFINYVADTTKGVNDDYQTKAQILAKTDLGAGNVQVSNEPGLESTQVARYSAPAKKATTLQELEAQRFTMDPLEYQTQLNALTNQNSDPLKQVVLGNLNTGLLNL